MTTGVVDTLIGMGCAGIADAILGSMPNSVTLGGVQVNQLALTTAVMNKFRLEWHMMRDVFVISDTALRHPNFESMGSF